MRVAGWRYLRRYGKSVWMTRIFPRLLLGLLTPMAATGGQHVLSVHVFNLSKVREAEVKRAVVVTSKVFDAAGVQLEWHHHDGGLSLRALDQWSVDGERIDRGVMIWLLGKDVSKRVSWKKTVGSAFEGEPGGQRNEAAIFYDRVVEGARLAQSSRSAILGYLMAHEIGHLLLGPNAHQPFGLMRETWEISELRSAERGDLHFFEGQAAKIRADVARRVGNGGR